MRDIKYICIGGYIKLGGDYEFVPANRVARLYGLNMANVILATPGRDLGVKIKKYPKAVVLRPDKSGRYDLGGSRGFI